MVDNITKHNTNHSAVKPQVPLVYKHINDDRDQWESRSWLAMVILRNSKPRPSTNPENKYLVPSVKLYVT
jgi:hypothetical protein